MTRLTRGSLFISALAMTCGLAYAQTPNNASSPETQSTSTAGAVQLEEVTVTAQKRSENLEQTPISITAITGETLQKQGLTDLTSVFEQTPGISFRSFGPGQTEIVMRGLAPTGGQSPTVGFYLDDVPLTAPTGAQAGKVVVDPNLYDLQRVEILRGPQGTLYGAGSMGGTVRLISNPPDLTAFSAKTLVGTSRTEGGGWNRAENAALNIPLISDTLAVRLVVSNSYDDGWLDRVVVNPFPLETDPTCPGFYGCTRGNVLGSNATADYRKVNDLSRTSGRLAIRYRPIDSLTIDVSALSQKAVTGGYSTFDGVPGTAAHYEPFNFPEPTSDRLDLFNLLVKYQLGQFEITSATSRWYRTLEVNQDSSEVVQDILTVPEFGYSGIFESDRTDQTSEELRIATTGTGPLSAVIGTFLSRFNSSSYDNWYGPGYADVLGTSLLVWYFQPTHIDQTAAFGDVSYQLTPVLKLTTGLRWYSYTNHITTTQYGALDGGPVPKVDNTGASASGYNPKFNLAYQPDEDTLLYATVAKGFRPGAGNAFIPTSGADSCAAALAALGLTGAPAQYQPDTLWSYELGGKLQFFDRTVTVNGAAYYERWRGVQQQVPLSCGYAFTANSGDAAVRGGELEIAARPIPQLLLALNGGYSRAYLTQNTPATGGIEGEQLQNVPKLTLSAALEYTAPVTSGYSLDAQLHADYVGPRADYLGPLPSYATARLRTGLVGDRLATYFYINNITKKMVYLSNATAESANLPSYNRIATEMPRTFGIDLSYKIDAPQR